MKSKAKKKSQLIVVGKQKQSINVSKSKPTRCLLHPRIYGIRQSYHTNTVACPRGHNW